MTRTNLLKGATLVELLTSVLIMLFCLAIIPSMIHSTGMTWNSAISAKTNKELLGKAIQKMSPILRNALSINTAQSSTHKLVAILPKADPVTKKFLSPTQPGDTYAFYLADITGASSSTGTILWRSINGTPDSSWSLRSGGEVDFGNSNLTFTFDSPSDPGLVTITANSTRTTNYQTTSATAIAEIQMRNHQISEANSKLNGYIP